ncbi:MAG: hypothetical protein WA581_06100 [Candidatus Acidiferrales bacterium]
MIATLEALPKLLDQERLERKSAVATLWAFWQELPENAQGGSIPGVPDDGAGFDAFDNWTAGLLRKGAEAYARAARITPDVLLNRCIWSARERGGEAAEEERDGVEQARSRRLRLEQEKSSRMLLEPNVLDKVARYESNLAREFLRSLHELQRLQAARAGAVVPPPEAVDVDVSVHPEGATPFAEAHAT